MRESCIGWRRWVSVGRDVSHGGFRFSPSVGCSCNGGLSPRFCHIGNNIVFIIQDADPPQSTFPEQFKQSYHDSYDPEEDSDRSEPETADKLWDALHTEQEGPGFEGAIKTARYLRAKAQSRSESDLTQENTAG